MITIEDVNSRQLQKIFINLPVSIYKNDAAWIQPLDIVTRDAIDFSHNPFYTTGNGKAFLAKKGNHYVGRILAHVSKRHHKLHQENVCYFGLFECTDDKEAAQALLEAAATFARNHSCSVLRGPFNLTAAQEIGLMTGGFGNAPAIDMVYTPEWYPELLKHCGFSACLTMQTWKNHDITALFSEEKSPSIHPPSLYITTRSLKFWKRSNDLENVRELINSAFLGNWGFIPITHEEWKAQIGALIPFLDPNLIIIAEHQGIPVGVTFAIPDYNKVIRFVNGKLLHPLIVGLLLPNRLKSAVVILFAVRKQFQNLGISHTLNKALIHNLHKTGYTDIATTWIADANLASLSQTSLLNMTPLHQLSMFEKAV